MKRSARSIALCLVLQAHASWGQQTGGRFGGSNWAAPPAAASPPAPSPPAPTTIFPPSAPMPMPGMPAPMPGMPAPPTPVAAPAPPPPPPAPPVTVLDYRRPSPRDFPVARVSRIRPVDDAEYQVAHPSRDYNTRYGPARTAAGLAAGAAFFGVGAALTFWLTRDGAGARPMPSVRPPMPSRAPGPMHHPGVEVRRVSIAFDWTARASIQHALATVSAAVDPGTPHGLHAAAMAARDALANAHRAARYGVFQSYALDPARGQQVFGQIADSLRGRYTVETVNNARRVAGPKSVARAEEGPGLVVVTLLVATKGPLPPLPPAMSLPALMAALEGLIPPRAEQLAALEVVWSPADEGDPMSSAELEVLYPELLRLDEGAGLGRRACGSCRAVYAGELGRCPACGGV
ncbi:MAG: DUF1517 domain-containing protein [Myxococcales bacterium]|nr:DUF1517 domain-containing protein [Myxococcales bacterium]